jgi:hypothetical protein
MAERGKRNSRFKNPASTVARRGVVVVRYLADDLGVLLATQERRRGPRGAA